MFSAFLAAAGRSRATHRSRARRGAAEVGEGVKDLLAGGVIGEHGRPPGRFRGGLVVLADEEDQGLAGDLQVADRLVQLAEPGGELVDLGLALPRFAG